MSDCYKCCWHCEFWDEIDGQKYHDGCICNNPKWRGKTDKFGVIGELNWAMLDKYHCCHDIECPYFNKEKEKK